MKKSKKISKKKENKKAKKSEENPKEEIKLEEEIKAAEEEIKGEPELLENFEPVRQLPITEVKAPVLERIIETQPEQQITRENFNNPIERTETQNRTNYSAQNQPNYSFQRNTSEERENQDKKYETKFVPPVLSRRETFRQEMRQEFLRPQQELQSQREEETLLDGIELLKQDMKLPFEQEQRKYKRHKLR